MEKNLFIGVDVSKKTLDIAVYAEGRIAKGNHLKVENEEEGYKAMLKWSFQRSR
jgi:hypothetical protein